MQEDQFFPMVAGGVTIGVIIFWVIPPLIRSAIQRRAQRLKQAEEDAHKQRELRKSLDSLLTTSRQTAGGLPDLVASAEASLDQAEEEYTDSAFAPFWDAVESAARNLATFNADLQALTGNSRKHRADAPQLAPPPEPFTLGISRLPDATGTANRMRSIVRVARKNFQFATIYEQRKTNQLLVSGFSTLNLAINDLSSRLRSSLDELTSSVSIQLSEIQRSQREAFDELIEEEKSSHAEISGLREDAATERERQQKRDEGEAEMLDNIQRRRKPSFPKVGDGEY